MKIFFIIANSLLGGLLLFFGVSVLFEVPLIGALLMVCGSVLFPLTRLIAHKVTKVAIKARYRVAICFSTFLLACGLIAYEGYLEGEKTMEYLAKHKAERDVENIAHFKENRDSIIESIKLRVSVGALKDALYMTEKYLVTNDPEIKSLHEEVTATYEPDKKYYSSLSESEKEEAIGLFGEPPSFYPFLGYMMITNYLERTLNDPDSLEMQNCSSVHKGRHGWLVSCTFRAKNGFGALIKSKKWFVINDGRVMYTHEYDFYD